MKEARPDQSLYLKSPENSTGIMWDDRVPTSLWSDAKICGRNSTITYLRSSVTVL